MGRPSHRERNSALQYRGEPCPASPCRFDEDVSGGIDVQELSGALTYLGVDTTSVQAKALLQAYDDYPDGQIDVKEFATLVRDVRLLLAFDKDSDGVLSEKELLPALP